MPTLNLLATVRTAAPGVRVIEIQGDINAASEEALAGAQEEASRGDTRAVVLDFTGLQFMNSGGIGLIVTMLIRAQRAGQKLCAFGLTEHYRGIFSLTRLDEAIEIFDDEAAAIAAL